MSDQHTVAMKTGLPVNSLVVPVDGSPFGERGVALARWLSPRLGASVHLINVSSSVEEAEARQEELRSLAATGGLPWEVVIAEDAPGAIDDARDRLNHALVCMASHGRGRSAALVGSVAAALLHDSELPTLLIGPRATVDETGSKRLVACVDGTPASEALIPVAAAWATALGLAMSIVTVAEPVPESIREAGRYARMFGPDIDADRYVADLVDQWRDRVPAVDGTAIYDPVTVAGGLVDHLEREGAVLVVLGTRARTGLPRLVLGSVAAAVVHESPVPALVVPLFGEPE
jgi:nucleotide-binding universal stress UspA family protein